MVIVIAVWLLAMVSGLSWGRRYTAAFSAAALAAFIAAQADALTAWTGWLQLGALATQPLP